MCSICGAVGSWFRTPTLHSLLPLFSLDLQYYPIKETAFNRVLTVPTGQAFYRKLSRAHPRVQASDSFGSVVYSYCIAI